VLPTVAGVTLERSGDKRWLQIESTPQNVWPEVVSFWREQGILLVEQDPAIGVMKTDWLENRAEVRKTSSPASCARSSTGSMPPRREINIACVSTPGLGAIAPRCT
jgi:uncharacterized lipoprotein